MTVTVALTVVLLVIASVLCGFGIWALIEVVRTARSVRVLSDDVNVRVVPLLDKADVTVDALNAELLRIDQIVTQVEEVTDRVNNTSKTVQEVANAPAEIVNDIADRVRRAWKTRKQTQHGHDYGADSSPAEEGAPIGGDADGESATLAPEEANPETHGN